MISHTQRHRYLGEDNVFSRVCLSFSAIDQSQITWDMPPGHVQTCSLGPPSSPSSVPSVLASGPVQTCSLCGFLLTSWQLAIDLNAILFIYFLLQYFSHFSDCCDVTLEHINCTVVQANEYSANSTCVYCPSTAIFATVSADSENVTAFVETGNVADSPVNVTTMMTSSEFVNTTVQPLLLVTNETIIYNTTKHFVSPAQEYFL